MQVGQIPSVKVTDFKIRCQFRDLASASGTTWAQLDPNPGGTYTADRLLLIEVTVRYLVRDMQGGYATPNDGPSGFRIEGDTTHGPWMTGGTRTITVSPRCLVLMQYLWSQKETSWQSTMIKAVQWPLSSCSWEC